MASGKDYTKYSFWITLLVIVILLGISFIPPSSVGGIKLKRANIISDIYTFDEANSGADDAELILSDKDFIEEIEKAETELAAATVSENDAENDKDKNAMEESWVIGAAAETGTGSAVANAGDAGETPRSGVSYENVVEIEDFSDGSRPSVADFCALLGTDTDDRIVRLAFLGDSYIEGDIMTADVRDRLQSAYGGGGVGFVPFATPLAQNRPTVKHSFGGWESYNLIQKKSAPEDVGGRFFISGIVSVPSEGAWAEYENTSFRKNLGKVSSARVLFTDTVGSTVTMTVNDTIEQTFTRGPADMVQQIHVTGAGIHKVRVSVSDPVSFYGYGVVLESDRGISVDNYSIRSNSGLALFGTSSAINVRMDKLLGYDLVVLQYGLNAMDPAITSYKGYGEQLRKVINYVKNCFPLSVIIVFSVGDRSTMQDGEFVSMASVKPMVKEQRAAAEECGVAFWNTFMAMGGENSMSRFVDNGWAAKDYTHLSFGGGRQIANKFVEALEYAKQQADTAARMDVGRQVEQSGVEDLESFGITEGGPGNDTIVESVFDTVGNPVETEDTEQAEPEDSASLSGTGPGDGGQNQ